MRQKHTMTTSYPNTHKATSFIPAMKSVLLLKMSFFLTLLVFFTFGASFHIFYRLKLLHDKVPLENSSWLKYKGTAILSADHKKHSSDFSLFYDYAIFF